MDWKGKHMSVFRHGGAALRVLKQDGLKAILSILKSKRLPPNPQSAESKWKAGVASEVEFWDEYFRTKGLQWTDTYGLRLNPDLPLQPRPATLLPSQPEVQILDVGAGPLTYLGKQHQGKRLIITAVDPLADEYNRILDKYHVQPVVRTQTLAAEDLTSRFSSDMFDLVFARNCIDHAHDPEKAVLEMVKVVKKGGYVLLEHRPNEAKNEGYKGLHQWNFSRSAKGEFLLGSMDGSVNLTKRYADRCAMTCEIVNEAGDGDWLITRIRKL